MMRIIQALFSAVVMAGLAVLVDWSSAGGRHARAADAEIPATNPFSKNEAAIRQGRSSYRSFCSPCHGGRADGQGERVVGSAANLTVFNKGFRKFVETVKHGKAVEGRAQNMPPWGGIVPDEEIYKIGAYLETLAQDGANWGTPAQ